MVQVCTSPITGLDVIYGANTAPPKGYHRINVDLNKRALGEYVYICYSTDPGEPPITNIQVFAGVFADFQIQNGYTKIDKDLNKGAAGKFIYLCYTRTKAFPPITEVDVVQATHRDVYPPTDEWV